METFTYILLIVINEPQSLAYYWYNQDDKNYFIISYAYIDDSGNCGATDADDDSGDDSDDDSTDITGKINQALKDAFEDLDDNIALY